MQADQILNDVKLDIDEKIYECAPSAIYVPQSRQRKEFKPEALADLARRIKEEGQHTPGLCFVNESGLPQLIFGERRLKACSAAGVPFRFQMATCAPNPYALAVLEFSENIAREELTWREKADAKAMLHRLFQERYGAAKSGPGVQGHSIRDTAAYLKQSYGSVAEDLELAEFARAVPEVAQARTRSDAKKLVERLKQEVTRDVLLNEARAKAEETKSELLISPSGQPTTLDDFEQQLVYYDKKVHCGDLAELVGSLKSPTLVIWDPPWGVEFDEVGQIASSQSSYSDSIDAFMQDFPRYAQILWDLMAPDSHLYVFFGIVNFPFIYDTLERVGFATNRMPLFWYKEGMHRTRAPERWPGRCYEPIAFAHKGNRPLSQRGRPDIIPTKPPTPTMKSCHPSAKHPDIYRDLLIRSCEPGDCVLDPMCGSGMFGVACESLAQILALDWTMVERSQEFRDLSLFNLARGYETLVGDSSLPAAAQLPDFRELVPGSPEWKLYWDTHPQDHTDMLAWRTARD